jgi:hypothetical protein
MSRFRRHARNLKTSLSTPADAWLLARMLGWSAVLPVAKFAIPLPRLVRLMHSRRRARSRDANREATIAGLAAWVFKTRPRASRDNCLERALVTYRYLSRAGADPELVVGLTQPSEGALGHAWVTVGGRAVHDEPEALREYATLLVFGSDGATIGPD